MSITEQLQRVGCVSDYEPRDIDDATLARIVEAAAWAPSAANVQPWEMIAVRSAEGKERIAQILLDSHLRPNVGGETRRSWTTQASILLVVCLDQTRAAVRFADVGKNLFGIQDTGGAIQNMRLVGLEFGVRSCLVREFDRQKMAELLALPKHIQPLIMITLGYSEVDARPLPRLPLADYLHSETW